MGMGGRMKGEEQEPKAPAQFTIMQVEESLPSYFFGWVGGEITSLLSCCWT